MERAAEKNDIIEKLQQQILAMQGFRQPSEQHKPIGLGAMEASFPNGIFPVGAVHEFLSSSQETAAATSGFMAGLLSRLMNPDSICLWVSTRRTLFPPALRLFGIAPEKIIFLDLRKEKEALWAIEEALKCDAIKTVVGELSEIDFAQSRRLQLAVEQSRVTGLVHCLNPGKISNTTAVSRWCIAPLASIPGNGMPGMGRPCWHVELNKVRNGRPGSWQMEWRRRRFCQLDAPASKRKTVLERIA